MIAPANEFRKLCRPRLERLGASCLASAHSLADDVSWIRKEAERIFQDATPESKAAYRHARTLLARNEWSGGDQWVAELLAVEEDSERVRRRNHRVASRLYSFPTNCCGEPSGVIRYQHEQYSRD